MHFSTKRSAAVRGKLHRERKSRDARSANDLQTDTRLGLEASDHDAEYGSCNLCLRTLACNYGVESVADLKEWLIIEGHSARLNVIYGVGPKTTEYIKILVGLHTAAPDTRLREFLAQTGIPSAGDVIDREIVNRTADLLSIPRFCFDHSISQYVGTDGGRERLREFVLEERSYRSLWWLDHNRAQGLTDLHRCSHLVAADSTQLGCAVALLVV